MRTRSNSIPSPVTDLRVEPESELDLTGARVCRGRSAACEWALVRMARFVAGRLPRDEQRPMREHLRACDPCGDVFAGEFNASLNDIDGIAAEPAPANGFVMDTLRVPKPPPELLVLSAATPPSNPADTGGDRNETSCVSFDEILKEWDELNRDSDV